MTDKSSSIQEFKIILDFWLYIGLVLHFKTLFLIFCSLFLPSLNEFSDIGQCRFSDKQQEIKSECQNYNQMAYKSS